MLTAGIENMNAAHGTYAKSNVARFLEQPAKYAAKAKAWDEMKGVRELSGIRETP